MKKFTLLLAAVTLFACSDDDGDPTTEQDSYSAHMKTQCPSGDENQVIYDVCVSESVYMYLAGLREATQEPNSCLTVTFEGLDGEVHEDYLVRVEKNQVDCTE